MNERIKQKLKNGDIYLKAVLIAIPTFAVMLAVSVIIDLNPIILVSLLCFMASVAAAIVYIEIFRPIAKSRKYLLKYGLEDCLCEYDKNKYDLPISKICLGEKSFYAAKPMTVIPYSMVVWVYIRRMSYMGVVPMSEEVIFCCRDGAEFNITANKGELPVLLQKIQTVSPDLIVGYGNEQSKMYAMICKEFRQNTKN